MLPEVCVESEIYMDVKFVKKMSLAYAGYISKIFTPFSPLLGYKLLPNTT